MSRASFRSPPSRPKSTGMCATSLHPSACPASTRSTRRAAPHPGHRRRAHAMNPVDTKPPPQGSPFWRFSLQFYRRPAVADACIALQEEAGVDVNLLLFLLWQATQRRKFSPAEVAALEGRIGPWRETTVIPLRAV